jgi:hypothetical protein
MSSSVGPTPPRHCIGCRVCGCATPGYGYGDPDLARRSIRQQGNGVVCDPLPALGSYRLVCRSQGRWLFTENEINSAAP